MRELEILRRPEPEATLKRQLEGVGTLEIVSAIGFKIIHDLADDF